MPACAIVKIKNGKIVSLDEYLDTAHTQALRTETSPQQEEPEEEQ